MVTFFWPHKRQNYTREVPYMSKLKKALSMFLCVCLLAGAFCMSAAAAGYSDTEGHWAREMIDNWQTKGYAQGYSDGSFHPDSVISRAEFVTFVCRRGAVDKSGSNSFSDVAAGDWFYKYVISSVTAGYINGYEDNTFRPNNPITRQEAAVIAGKIIEKAVAEALSYADGDSFADSDKIAAWAVKYVRLCVKAGIITGYEDNTFRPEKNITRAEALKMIEKAFEVLESSLKDDDNDEPVMDDPVYIVPDVYYTDVAVSPAILNDCRDEGPVAAEELCSGYTATAKKASNKDCVDVTVSAADLRCHVNADGSYGYWAGFAVAAPEGAAQMKYALAKTREELVLSEDGVDLETSVTEAGDSGIAFYTDFGSKASKLWCQVQWLDENGNPIGSTTTYYVNRNVSLCGVMTEDELEYALNNMSETFLGCDIMLSRTLDVESGCEAILDLNGFTLTSPAIVANRHPGTNTINTTAIQVLENAKLTLTDKSEAGSGKITSPSGINYFYSVDAIVKNFGTFNMSKGTIQTSQNVYYALLVSGENSITNISGGKIVSEWTWWRDSKGVAIGTNDGKTNEGYTINITGGEIVGGELAMYLPSSGTVSISDGELSGNKEGIEIRAGVLNISGGKISATAARNRYASTNSGSTGSYTGALVAAKSRFTTASSYNGDIIINITGGTIENATEGGDAICVAHENHAGYTNTQLVQVTVEDSGFLSGGVNRIGNFAADDSNQMIDFLYIKDIAG
ncbi:MAG: S-layer homology domain-containing protein [Clostridia bacterium]|nr:S-layer homology domain-containing protein [Clostridia bacterium]